ncbi:hypothetical protein DM806_15255 [Sphingobium lactosutens]|nr:hypothetical protein [Sphingobium lactosutens]
MDACLPKSFARSGRDHSACGSAGHSVDRSDDPQKVKQAAVRPQDSAAARIFMNMRSCPIVENRRIHVENQVRVQPEFIWRSGLCRPSTVRLTTGTAGQNRYCSSSIARLGTLRFC